MAVALQPSPAKIEGAGGNGEGELALPHRRSGDHEAVVGRAARADRLGHHLAQRQHAEIVGFGFVGVEGDAALLAHDGNISLRRTD